MKQDIKCAWRRLVRAPFFSVIAVLMLATGIGAATAVYSFYNGIFLQHLPIRDPDSLALVCRSGARDPRAAHGNDLYCYQDYENFREHGPLSPLIANGTEKRSLAIEGHLDQSKPGMVGEVSGNFFSELGLLPEVGRVIGPADDDKDHPAAVVVLNHAYWEKHFAGQPDAIGKTMLIDRVIFQIIGVAPEEFHGLEPAEEPDVFIPLRMISVLTAPNAPHAIRGPVYAVWLQIAGRLPDAKAKPAIEEALEVIYEGDLKAGGVPSEVVTQYFGKVKLLPGAGGYNDEREPLGHVLMILAGLVTLLLLVCCANVASLTLLRAVKRQSELALRAALGANRGHIFRDVIAESVILVSASACLGVLFAKWGISSMAYLLPGSEDFEIVLDSSALLFGTGLSVVVAILIGAIPGLRMRAVGLTTSMSGHSNTVVASSRHRMGKALVLAQISLSLCLVAGAGLLLRTLVNLRHVQLGFNVERQLLTVVHFDNKYTPAQRHSFFTRAAANISELPGVEGVAYFDGGLLLNDTLVMPFAVDGYVPERGELVQANITFAGPDFFRLVNLPITHGRALEGGDFNPPNASAGNEQISAAVVSESLAARYFTGRDPLGATIRNATGQKFRIVGVARDALYADLRDTHATAIYYPISQGTGAPSNLVDFVIHTRSLTDSLNGSCQQALQKADPSATILLSTTIDGIIDRRTANEQIEAKAAGYFSGFSLILAGFGLYAILAYEVVQRRREIAVRVALGASPVNIIQPIVLRGVTFAVAGVTFGCVLAFAASKYITSHLYAVTGTDPATFALAGVVLIGVAVAASWIPAAKGARVDPMLALRPE